MRDLVGSCHLNPTAVALHFLPMNLKAELDLPVFIDHGRAVTLREFAVERKNVLEGRTLRSFSAEIKSLLLANEAVASYTPPLARQLALARLRANPTAVFRFVGGKKFSASEAMNEIERDTAAGKYFTKIQKRAAEIALEAVKTGILNPADFTK